MLVVPSLSPVVALPSVLVVQLSEKCERSLYTVKEADIVFYRYFKEASLPPSNIRAYVSFSWNHVPKSLTLSNSLVISIIFVFPTENLKPHLFAHISIFTIVSCILIIYNKI